MAWRGGGEQMQLPGWSEAMPGRRGEETANPPVQRCTPVNGGDGPGGRGRGGGGVTMQVPDWREVRTGRRGVPGWSETRTGRRGEDVALPTAECTRCTRKHTRP